MFKAYFFVHSKSRKQNNYFCNHIGSKNKAVFWDLHILSWIKTQLDSLFIESLVDNFKIPTCF